MFMKLYEISKNDKKDERAGKEAQVSKKKRKSYKQLLSEEIDRRLLKQPKIRKKKKI